MKATSTLARVVRHQQERKVGQRHAQRGHRQNAAETERGHRDAAQEGATDAHPHTEPLGDGRDVGLVEPGVEVERPGHHADDLVRELEQPDEGQQHQRQRNAVAAEEAGDGLDERLGDIDAALHGGGRTLRFGAQQRGDDRQQHQCRHGQIGHDPAFELGQVQRAGTGQDQADPVTQRIGGRQRGLRRLRRDLDAVGVDGRVLGGTGERGHQHPGHQRPDALLGTHEGQCDQADQHQRLRHQQPRAAAAEPTEQREGIALQQGRPQELEQVEEAGQADQADAAQVQADVAQARGQGLRGDQQERQAAAEAEHGHGQRRRSAEGALDACPALVADRQALVAIDRAAAQAVTQARGDELVVDAPTDIVGAGGAAVAPPGVVLAGGVEQAVGIGPAAAGGDIGGLAVVGAQRVEPVALFRQAAGSPHST
ncbi:hypothetical protein G6F57_015137 [Rhizopus arrhizus]|nr:hypothetical protein G6F57_015137 [Rhizopus arrhizus]